MLLFAVTSAPSPLLSREKLFPGNVLSLLSTQLSVLFLFLFSSTSFLGGKKVDSSAWYCFVLYGCVSSFIPVPIQGHGNKSKAMSCVVEVFFCERRWVV